MKRAKSVCISSGKGGVGKTLSSIGIALSLQKQGYKTVLIDGDLNLANIDVLLNVSSRYSIFEVLSGKIPLHQVLCTTVEGLRVLPASSGIPKMGNEACGLVSWSRVLSELDAYADIVVIDGGAGLGKEIITFNALASLNLVVTTPDPHAITDAYALIKTLTENQSLNDVELLVNLCSSDFEGQEVFERISGVCKEFLSIGISHAGCTKSDSNLARLVRYQAQSIVEILKTNAGQTYCQIADRVASKLLRQPQAQQQSDYTQPSFKLDYGPSWERSA